MGKALAACGEWGLAHKKVLGKQAVTQGDLQVEVTWKTQSLPPSTTAKAPLGTMTNHPTIITSITVLSEEGIVLNVNHHRVVGQHICAKNSLATNMKSM